METREILDRLARNRSLPDVKRILDSATHVLADDLAAHDSITLPGIGTFGAREHQAHAWYHPALHRRVWMRAYYSVFFHPAKALKRALGRRA